MSDLFSKSVEDSFDAWLADDSTHWVGDQDAAWQAWMYVNEQIVDPLNIQTEQLKAESAGLKTVYEAYERVNAGLNQRIANLELCQTASLGVSGIIKSAASEMGFDAAGEDSALDHLIGLARSAAALRAENEALKKRLAPMDNFNRQQVPVIGYTGCLVCGQFT
ncbi:MoxJ protein, partial [Pseudomonas syringae]